MNMKQKLRSLFLKMQDLDLEDDDKVADLLIAVEDFYLGNAEDGDLIGERRVWKDMPENVKSFTFYVDNQRIVLKHKKRELLSKLLFIKRIFEDWDENDLISYLEKGLGL